jgi:arylsulfatase A-like enzyme
MFLRVFNKYFHFTAILLCFTFIAGCAQTKTKTSNKPNILFILADDLGWADLGYTGSEFYETPNLDRLAAEGMVFTNAYAAAPICSPSRAAILSGKYPARLHLTDWIPGNPPAKNQQLAAKPFKKQLDIEEVTLAEALKSGGYKTFFSGKWHLGEEPYYPKHQGFEINMGGNHTGHPSSYFSPYKNPQLPDGPEGEYLTDRLTDETILFMEQEKNHPFFAFLSFYTVHLPLQGKQDKVEKYRKKLEKMTYSGDDFVQQGTTYFKNHQNDPVYAAMVESMDENVGRLLKFLDENGLAKNTIIVFTSDNGGMSSSNQTNNIPTSNLPLRAGKGYLYEGGIREPLIIRWPDKIKKNSESDFPVTGTDFYPTLLSLASLPLQPDQHKDGISFKPILEGEVLEARPVFWHYPHYSGGLGGKPSGAVRFGDYKLIEFYEDMKVELYNVVDDIGEENNLALTMPDKAKTLLELLHQSRKETNAQMPIKNIHFEKD